MRRLFVLLLLIAIPVCVPGQQTSDDALKLLNQVAAHYRDAEYLHMEATTLATNHSPRRDGSETWSTSIRIAPGGRMRYAGEDGLGSSEIVSNGTDEWRVMNGFAEYAKAPAGYFFHSRQVYSGDNSSLFRARESLGSLAQLDTGIRSAHFLPDEKLQDGGKTVLCTVVQFGFKDSSYPSRGTEWQKTVWIERSSLRVVKLENRSSIHFYFGPVPAPHSPPFDRVETMTVTLSDFSFQPTADTFVFTPPPGASEVAKLPTGLMREETEPDPRVKAAAEHIGKPLPPLTLHDAYGKPVALSSFRGHPLLIDVWATWCGPCIAEMPAINRIRKSTATTDLKMLGIDQDRNSADAVALLKNRGYDWDDLPYTPEFVKAMAMSGIPLLVLVDAKGTMVYYHTGADDAKGLAAAIAKLGPAYEGVKVE